MRIGSRLTLAIVVFAEFRAQPPCFHAYDWIEHRLKAVIAVVDPDANGIPADPIGTARQGFGDDELEEPPLALRVGEQRTSQYPVKLRQDRLRLRLRPCGRRTSRAHRHPSPTMGHRVRRGRPDCFPEPLLTVTYYHARNRVSIIWLKLKLNL